MCQFIFLSSNTSTDKLFHTSGEKDARCPLAGLEIPKHRAVKAYEDANCPDNFKVWTCL